MFRALCAVLALAGLLGLLQPQPPTSHLLTPAGDLVTVLAANPGQGTVLVVHSVFQDRETALPLARALQRSGFTALSVKLQPGRPFHQYVATLRSLCHQYRNDGPLYAVGHSMGADLVTTLAADETDISAVVAVGFPADTGLLECPAMLAAGAWDQVHTRAALTKAAAGATLVISPFSDHSQETLDPFIWSAVSRHFKAKPPGFRLNRVLAEGLYVLGFAGLLFTFPLPFEPRKTALALFLLTAAVGLAHRLWPHELLHPTLLALWLGSAIGSAVGEQRETRTATSLFTIAAGSLALSWALNCYQNVIAEPRVLVGLPVAVLSWAPILTARVANTLFYDVPGTTGLSAVFLALLLLEVVWPGRLFGWVFRGAAAMVSKIEHLQFETGPRPSAAHLGILGLLLMVAIALWQNVKKAGYILDPSDAIRLGWKFFVLLLLPALLFAAATRIVKPSTESPIGE